MFFWFSVVAILSTVSFCVFIKLNKALGFTKTSAVIITIAISSLLLYFSVSDGYKLAVKNSQSFEYVSNFVRQVRLLKKHLENFPKDGEGTLMLANAYKALGYYEDAQHTYARASEIVQLTSDVQISYAESIFMANEGVFTPKAVGLLEQALSEEPENTNALWLRGVMKFQAKEYDEALIIWEMVEENLDLNAEVREILQKNILKARMLSKSALAQEKEVEPLADELTVKILLDESLKEKWSGDEILFVYVQASDGPKMPLAVRRLDDYAFPVEVLLSSEFAMVNSTKLSDFNDIVVTARVSSSGMAKKQPGDLVGKVDHTTVTSEGELRKNVEVLIDTVVP